MLTIVASLILCVNSADLGNVDYKIRTKAEQEIRETWPIGQIKEEWAKAVDPEIRLTLDRIYRDRLDIVGNIDISIWFMPRGARFKNEVDLATKYFELAKNEPTNRQNHMEMDEYTYFYDDDKIATRLWALDFIEEGGTKQELLDVLKDMTMYSSICAEEMVAYRWFPWTNCEQPIEDRVEALRKKLYE